MGSCSSLRSWSLLSSCGVRCSCLGARAKAHSGVIVEEVQVLDIEAYVQLVADRDVRARTHLCDKRRGTRYERTFIVDHEGGGVLGVNERKVDENLGAEGF